MPVHRVSAAAWSGRDDPEDGRLARRLHHLAANDGSRALIGFACDAGVRRNLGRPGAAEGPSALRAAMRNLAAPNGMATFVDLGDVVVTEDDLEAGQDLLAQSMAPALATTTRIVALGGGHETALASYTALRSAFPSARIGIVNIDAHLDIRLPTARGPSSGTPFAQVRALSPAEFDYLCIGVAPEANTQALFERAAEWGVRTIADSALLNDKSAADGEIDAIAARCDLLYLTICLDSIAQAPGVSAPATRGLPFPLVERLIGRVLAHGKTRLADIVELSPPHDVAGVTARMGAFLALRLLAT
jgi:formiminoglutamase